MDHDRTVQAQTAAPIARSKAEQWARAMQAAQTAAGLAERTCDELVTTRPTFHGRSVGDEPVPREVLVVGDHGELFTRSGRVSLDQIPAMHAWLDEWFGVR